MSPIETDIRSEIRDYVEENFLYMHPDSELRDDENLLAAGLIDSLGFLELVEMIQERFSISITDAEITEQNFGSINAMVTFIGHKSNG